MRVHHIINNVELKKGGAQRVVRQLHESLRSQGVDSHLVALCDSVDSVTDAISLENKSPYSWRAFTSTVHYIRQHCSSNDIIHVHLFPALLYVALAVKLLRWSGKLVCTEHNTHNRRRSHPVGKLIDQLVYPAYRQIYCISQGTVETLTAWMPSQENKLKVIENGVELTCKKFVERAKKNKLVVVSAGRLHKQKNYETAIEAMALLLDLDVEYRIAGIGEEAFPLRELCADLSLENRVTFYGYVANMSAFLEEADVFLMPSRWEGFGLAAVEAMNAGLPAIASNVAGIREIFDTPCPCGVLVSSDSPIEIANAVRLLLDSDSRLTMGENAFERSLFFSKERMIKGYQKAYEQLTGKKI